jgi:hypothetical protein
VGEHVHADRSERRGEPKLQRRLPGVRWDEYALPWIPACKCGWEGGHVRRRDEARRLRSEHERWAWRSVALQVRREREQAARLAFG